MIHKDPDDQEDVFIYFKQKFFEKDLDNKSIVALKLIKKFDFSKIVYYLLSEMLDKKIERIK